MKNCYYKRCVWGSKYVTDTKYKTSDSPSSDDIAQVAAYAELMICPEAVLGYPKQLARSFDGKVGNIRVRSLVFAIDSDLEEAGVKLLQQLLE